MYEKTPLLRKSVIFVLLIIAIGIALRTVQYIGGSSMWLDELASAKNIETRNLYQLTTESLDFNQVAPLGFLFTQKLFISVFGASDLAHRFLPWIASLISLFLFWRISRYFLNGVYLLSALLLFASSVSMIWLGSNVKHYSGEVAATIFLIWAGLSFSANKKNTWYWGAGIAGALSCLLSFPAAVMSIGVLALIFFQHRTEWTRIKNFYFIIAALWLLAAGINLLYGKLAVAEQAVFGAMHEYWQEGFPPLLNPITVIAWIYNSTIQLIAIFLFYIPPKPVLVISFIVLLFSVPGIIYGFKRMRFKTAMLLLPYVTAIALALFDFYPWRHRVAAYSIWPFLILAPLGLFATGTWLKKKFAYRLTKGFAFTLAVLVLLVILVVGRPPFIVQPSEPVLKEVKKAMQPGDVIYVYTKGRYAMSRYGPKVGINNWITGKYYPEASGYRNDLQMLKGKPRVWFFYTQWTKPEPFPDSIKVYLENMGRQLYVISKPVGKSGQDLAAAHLYDLSVQ